MAWNNPDDYAYLKSDRIGLDQWAWEFIRRNPQYIQDWQKSLKRWRKKKASGDPRFLANRPELQSQIYKHMPNFFDEHHPEFATRSTHPNNPWYLARYYPNDVKTPKSLHFRSMLPFAWIEAPNNKKITIHPNKHELIISTDTRLPPSAQIEHIQELIFQSFEQHKKRGRAISEDTLRFEDRSGWIDCLRVWDGYNEGASTADIAHLFFPNDNYREGEVSKATSGERRVYRMKDKARQWIETNFVKLIYKHQTTDSGS